MPRKGKRSQAQKIRWTKLDLEDEHLYNSIKKNVVMHFCYSQSREREREISHAEPQRAQHDKPLLND